MNKAVPIIGLIIGAVVLAGAFLFVRGRQARNDISEAENVPELPFSQRPFTSLTPTEDGHFLNLLVENIIVEGAETAEYELLYQVEDGRTQGVPGVVQISPGESVRQELLLGSESSSVFRYDEGVEAGTLTLRFRDSNGKLLGRLKTDFQLVSGVRTFDAPDGSKLVNLEEPSDDFYIAMNTFGIPGNIGYPDDQVYLGPYGIFPSSSRPINGTASPGVYYLDNGKWQFVGNSEISGLGVFLLLSPSTDALSPER